MSHAANKEQGKAQRVTRVRGWPSREGTQKTDTTGTDPDIQMFKEACNYYTGLLG